ncbi:MAG TPA: TadE/TadG family type IV pilus assembly protein [Vicinamibacterales bacterium]|jgi:Flp pilus assembly protein TadG
MTRRVSHRVFRRLKDSKGTSLVEAALITPLLLLLTFGICEFASLFYVYLALENGVSQASRFGVTGNVTGTSTREDSIRAAMRDATPTLTLDDSAFTFSHMPIGGTTWTAGGAGSTDELERVTVDYTWNIMTPLLWPFFTNGQIHFSVNSTMKNESRFQ